MSLDTSIRRAQRAHPLKRISDHPIEFGPTPPGGMMMHGALIVLSVNGTMLATPYARPVWLRELRAAIGGGYLEMIPHFDTFDFGGETHPCVAFCDEQGKLHGAAQNERASAYWAMALARAKQPFEIMDILVGPVLVVIGDDEFMQAL